MEGDLKGYLSGKSTRTFHMPPSYGAKTKWPLKKCNSLSAGPKNLTINSFDAPRTVTSWLLSILCAHH